MQIRRCVYSTCLQYIIPLGWCVRFVDNLHHVTIKKGKKSQNLDSKFVLHSYENPCSVILSLCQQYNPLTEEAEQCEYGTIYNNRSAFVGSLLGVAIFLPMEFVT